jgi:hypothetical protein
MENRYISSFFIFWMIYSCLGLGITWPWLISVEFNIFMELVFSDVKPIIVSLLCKSVPELLMNLKK